MTCARTVDWGRSGKVPDQARKVVPMLWAPDATVVVVESVGVGLHRAHGAEVALDVILRKVNDLLENVVVLGRHELLDRRLLQHPAQASALRERLADWRHSQLKLVQWNAVEQRGSNSRCVDVETAVNVSD